MDVANILADIALDVYDNNDFEQEEDNNINTSNLNINNKLSILQNAAKQIDKVDREIVSEAIEKEAVTIKADYNNVNNRVVENKQDQKDVKDEKDIDINNKKENDVQETNNNISESKSNDDIDDENELSSNSSDDDSDSTFNDEIRNLNTLYLASVYRGERKDMDDYIKQGAVVNCIDRHGWTAIHFAASKDFNDIIELIIKKLNNKNVNVKKFINRRDKITGWTALHIACVNCNINSIKTLLSHGAKRKIKNDLGELPVHCIGNHKDRDKVFHLVKLKNMINESKL